MRFDELKFEGTRWMVAKVRESLYVTYNLGHNDEYSIVQFFPGIDNQPIHYHNLTTLGVEAVLHELLKEPTDETNVS